MGYDGCAAYTFIVAGQLGKYFEKIIHVLQPGPEYAKPETPVYILDKIPRKELERIGLHNHPHLTDHPIGGFLQTRYSRFH